MKSRLTFSPRIAWSIAGLNALLLVAGILLVVLAVSEAGNDLGLPARLATIPISATYAGLGTLVLSRHPRHPVAWILVAIGMIAGLEVLDFGYLAYVSQASPKGILAAPVLARWSLFWIHTPRALLPITLLILLFPDGKLPSIRWWPLGATVALALIFMIISFAFSSEPREGFGMSIENPFGVQSDLMSAARVLGSVFFALALIGSLASLFVRLRRSTGIERQQMKWMAYAVTLVFLAIVIAALLYTALPDGVLETEISFGAQFLAFVSPAAAAGIAVLRYRLYEIDTIINRSLVYGALTLLIAGLYVGLVVALGAAFQTRGNLLISLAATGVVAVLFQPMRERLQVGVNRLFYGERDKPYAVLSQLGRQLEEPTAPEALLGAIVETIAQTLKLPYVAIALPDEEGYKIACAYGKSLGERLTLSLTAQGREVGRLICAPRGLKDPFTEAEEALLHDIANQAAVAVHALRLSAELQRSRERLVSAREEERRRLRRDLHDGLGPQLASLGLKLDAARNQLVRDPQKADAILKQLRSDVRAAIADIRRLVYNLRPPVLDELGLISALRASAVAELSMAGPKVIVEGPEKLPTLPAAVEVAAYRIAQEAVTNVARHAHAEHCYVRLHLNDVLQLEIQDDGEGLPTTFQPGVGLQSMHERASELGGWFKIEALTDGGTRVVAELPLSQQIV